MGKAIEKYQGAGPREILSLNIEDLDVVELERRLEMAVAFGTSGVCGVKTCATCTQLTSCGTYCN
jgi:hypothetical protein